MPKDIYKNLRVFNIVMGFIHLIQGALMLYLSNSFALPITTSYLSFDLTAFKLVPVMETPAELLIGPLVALFLLLSSIAHFTISMPGIYEWYVKNLKKGLNYARWYEYSLSSSVMMVVISMLVGVYDLSTLLLIFFMNAMMILWGLMMERHNQLTQKVGEKTDWLAFVIGCVAGILPWIVVALYLFNSGDGENKAPTFVYWIFFSIFLFFNVFAGNMILQYKKVGKWKDYTFGEKVYVVLSLLAKSALAWQVFFATLRPV